MVTKGLLTLDITREELESVLAHEIGHLSHRDNSYAIATSTILLLLFIIGIGLLVAGYLMAVATASMATYNDRHRTAAGFAGLIGLGIAAIGALLTFLSIFVNIPVLAFLRLREHLADIYAAKTTRNDSLITALRKIQLSLSQGTPSKGIAERIRPGVKKILYIIPALSGGSISILFSTHPSLEERELIIKAYLEELMRRA